MIAKTITSSSFKNLIGYLLEREHKEEAKVLKTHGVRDDRMQHMIKDFEWLAAQRPSKQKAAMHLILSFHKQEKISEEKAVQIAEAFLKEVNITNTQYSIIQHAGVKEHQHLHIACNLVDFDAKAINESFMGVRCKKAAEKITKEFSLIQSEGRSKEYTNLEALTQQERAKAEIYFTAKELLTYVNSLIELKTELKKQSIDLTLIGKQENGELVGIRLGREEEQFKGSQVHKTLALNHIAEQIAANRTRQINEKKTQETGKHIHTEVTVQDILKEVKPDEYLQSPNEKDQVKEEITKKLSKLLTYVPSIKVLQEKLLEQGIETIIHLKQPSGIVKGVSFKKINTNTEIKGSELARKFSYSNILKTIEQNRLAAIQKQRIGKSDPIVQRISSAIQFVNHQQKEAGREKPNLKEIIHAINLRGVAAMPVYQKVSDQKEIQTWKFGLIENANQEKTFTLHELSHILNDRHIECLINPTEQDKEELLNDELSVPGIFFSYEPEITEFILEATANPTIIEDCKESLLGNFPQLENEIAFIETMAKESENHNKASSLAKPRRNHWQALFRDYGAVRNRGGNKMKHTLEEEEKPKSRKKLRRRN